MRCSILPPAPTPDSQVARAEEPVSVGLAEDVAEGAGAVGVRHQQRGLLEVGREAVAGEVEVEAAGALHLTADGRSLLMAPATASMTTLVLKPQTVMPR